MKGVDTVQIPENQYSYQHVKSFGQQNSLVPDRWNLDLVFYVDQQWRVMQMLPDLDQPSLKQPVEVFAIPNKDNQRHVPGRCHVTISFPSKETAVVSDGVGTIYLLHTGDRKDSRTWLVRHSSEPFAPEPHPCTLSDSVLYTRTDDEKPVTVCDIVLLGVEDQRKDEGKEDNKKSPFVTKLTWINFISEDGVHWSESRRRQLIGPCVPDLVTSASRGQGLVIASERPFRLVLDSDRPEAEVTEQMEEPVTEEPPEALYNWSQTQDDVTAVFAMPESAVASDVTYTLTSTDVDLGIRDQGALLKGQLYSVVRAEESTWTVSDGRLELVLSKQTPGLWQELVVGDKSGRLVLDAEQLANLDDIASSLRSDPSLEGAPYNAQELEDVDAYPDDTAVLVFFNGETNAASHQAFINSHQWLFNARIHSDKPLAICLRHDVDGLLWQLGDDADKPWEHTATFNAFGYVQASKRDRKFASCSPDFSYSVICDCVRHVYIYRRHSPTNTPLRNRKTGENVEAIAKQQLVSLESTDPILGMCCNNEKLFLLTEKKFYVVRINVSELI